MIDGTIVRTGAALAASVEDGLDAARSEKGGVPKVNKVRNQFRAPDRPVGWNWQLACPSESEILLFHKGLSIIYR